MKKLQLIFFLSITVLLVSLTMPGCSASTGDAAPEVNAQQWLNADSFSLATNKDKIVIVEFWATWCPPCRASIPHLRELHDKYKDQGVVLVSLTNEPANQQILNFCKTAGMTWIVGLGSSSGSSYGVSGIPHAAIVVDGKIAWKGHPMDGMDKKVADLVAARTQSPK